MRPFLMPILFVTVAMLAAWLIIRWIVRTAQRDHRPAITRVLAAQGPARCVEAVRLLRHLTTLHDQRGMSQVWEAIELPLLQALPDCPPDYKIEVINALDAAAHDITNRDLAKRVMTMRNSLIA